MSIIFSKKTDITDYKVLTKYVSAMLLGDGCLSFSNERSANARYSLTQIADHYDYVEWQADILSNLTNVTVWRKESWIDSIGTKRKTTNYLKTQSVPFFTTIRNRNYIEGKKVVSHHDIKLFDWECLAIWYMDDGNLEVKKQVKQDYVRITLCTNSFSYGDCLLLRTMLKDKFDIGFDVSTMKAKSGAIQYTLRTSKEYAKRFIQGVTPYVKPSFYYKLKYDIRTNEAL